MFHIGMFRLRTGGPSFLAIQMASVESPAEISVAVHYEVTLPDGSRTLMKNRQWYFWDHDNKEYIVLDDKDFQKLFEECPNTSLPEPKYWNPWAILNS